jgi:hypothetical protein
MSHMGRKCRRWVAGPPSHAKSADISSTAVAKPTLRATRKITAPLDGRAACLTGFDRGGVIRGSLNMLADQFSGFNRSPWER